MKSRIQAYLGYLNAPLLLIALLMTPLVSVGQDDEAFLREWDKAVHGKHLTPITSFGYIYVNRYHSGQEIPDGKKSKGFDIDDELTDFLQLRFKNNFADIPYEFGNLFALVDRPDVAVLQCYVWLHGDSYPVAFHIDCRLGIAKKSRILTSARLGVTSMDNSDTVVKEVLDSMISDLALRFFLARGDL